jgi:hypothetical protein
MEEEESSGGEHDAVMTSTEAMMASTEAVMASTEVVMASESTEAVMASTEAVQERSRQPQAARRGRKRKGSLVDMADVIAPEAPGSSRKKRGRGDGDIGQRDVKGKAKEKLETRRLGKLRHLSTKLMTYLTRFISQECSQLLWLMILLMLKANLLITTIMTTRQHSRSTITTSSKNSLSDYAIATR